MTCKETIIKYLINKPEGVAGGTIEREVADDSDYKPSTIARELRSLYNPVGKLQRRYTQKSPHWVIYRLR